MSRVFSRTLSVAQWRRFRRDENGSVLAYMVVIPVLAGALAIGVETGQLYRVKHQMQGAADDAALAYAYDVIKNNSASASADALYEAQRNGFTNGANTVTVSVNIPPTQGPNVGTSGAVEVVITKTQNLSFASLLNSASSGYALTARSVAIPVATTTTTNTTTTTTTTTSNGCLVALTSGNEQGVTYTSSGSFTADCMIMSNATATGTGAAAPPSTGASVYMGNSGTGTNNSKATFTNSGGIWTRGSLSTNTIGTLVVPAGQTMINQTSSIVDPYAGLAAPSPGTCSFTNYREPSGSTLTVSPGTYCGGLSVTSKTTVYFTPGTYYITNGDLIISSDTNVSCPTCTGTDGTTFVLTQTSGNNADIAGAKITSDGTLSLKAPTVSAASSTYPYPGVLFFQDRNATVGTMTATAKIFAVNTTSSATLSGAIYFPNNAIRIASISSSGSSNTTGCTVWIGRYIHSEQYIGNYIAGCGTATKPAGYSTTTTTTTPTTTTTTTTKATLVQ